jgi:hypothetical protein
VRLSFELSQDGGAIISRQAIGDWRKRGIRDLDLRNHGSLLHEILIRHHYVTGGCGPLGGQQEQKQNK